MNVFDLKRGEQAEIKSIEISGGALERLTALGFTVGKKIELLSYSLFKSGALISCGAVRLGVRSTLAKKITVACV